MKKVFYPCFIALLCSCSSSPKSEMVSQTMYDEKIAEYKSLNERQAAIINDNLKKSKVINNVVNELRQLTNATIQLRQNVEQGQGQMNQAEEIRQRLNQLKKQLKSEKQPSQQKNDKELLATITNLHEIIVQKEKEITDLQQQIKQKDKTISQQNNTIEEQLHTIERQKQQLIAKQQEMWFTLGKELQAIAKELPKVKGRKDKRNMKSTRYYILNKSKECFDQAAQLGHYSAAIYSREVSREMKDF